MQDNNTSCPASSDRISLMEGSEAKSPSSRSASNQETRAQKKCFGQVAVTLQSRLRTRDAYNLQRTFTDWYVQSRCQVIWRLQRTDSPRAASSSAQPAAYLLPPQVPGAGRAEQAAKAELQPIEQATAQKVSVSAMETVGGFVVEQDRAALSRLSRQSTVSLATDAAKQEDLERQVIGARGALSGQEREMAAAWSPPDGFLCKDATMRGDDASSPALQELQDLREQVQWLEGALEQYNQQARQAQQTIRHLEEAREMPEHASTGLSLANSGELEETFSRRDQLEGDMEVNHQLCERERNDTATKELGVTFSTWRLIVERSRRRYLADYCSLLRDEVQQVKACVARSCMHTQSLR
eukprot:GEMP01050977.1.p1 GENE.GEMP01050977.1~~GEMP01050977.1.p1  ORF type:complete len:354 (+),score=86.84 GEMP01050977.1:416-1477(+)